MAACGDGPSTETSHSGKKGMTIDSTLINTAKSDIQNELSSLGVSVYNQLDFEAGILRQIDEEVQRRNAEQDKKFLLNDYNKVKGEMNSLRLELTNVSKSIAGLISQPLSSVTNRLTELKAAQEQKKKQLKALEVREHTILQKLTNQHETGSGKSIICDGPQQTSNSDVVFGLKGDEQRLIQTGQMTPFGTSVDVPIISSDRTVTKESSVTELADTRDSDVPAADKKEPTAKGDLESSTLNSAASRKEPVLKLSSDSFDGLFTSAPVYNDRKTSTQKRARIPKKKKLTESQDSQASSVTPLTSSSLEPNMEKTSSDCEDCWMPNLSDLLESDDPSSESEYFTDEELGGVKKKKKKLRELSSDDLSDEDSLTGTTKRGQRKRIRKKKRKKAPSLKYNDDGDRELYQDRLQEYERSVEKESPPPPDMKFDGGLTIPGSLWHRLYRFQQTGVKWLWELHCQQAGGIIGDEMGLGKTIQAIVFLAGLKISNLRSHVTRKLGLGPVLIVCPATVMHQWVSEFHSWWPPFRVAVLHTTGTYSGSKKHLLEELINDDGVIITTYSGIRLHKDIIFQHKWDYVLLDEGQKIKNPDAEITLACKQVATPHRLILSGSPIQNNLKELWSLFDFVFPGKLGTLPVFLEQFSVPITLGGYANATEVQVQTAYKCACILRDTINPYMLRRLKADVKVQLPDKNEQVLFCKLTDYQRELYQDYVQSSAVQIMLDRGKEVFAGISTLRQLCNHPDLVTNDYSDQTIFGNKDEASKKEEEEEDMYSGFHRITVKKTIKKGSASVDDFDNEETYGHWRRSGKMIVVESLLKLWKAQNHKVLLFTQSRRLLDILERFVKGKQYTYQKMDGTTPISTRQSLVEKFNEDESIFAFLLTTRVGGLGVNLIGADRVVIYDPDWNPSTDTQARERAWRIGQTRQVTIYRLLTSGTIEEKIYHRQIFKQFLINRVLKDPRQRRFFKSNSLHELFTLSSSDTDGGTETSAIFAGTGSEILPKFSDRHKSNCVQKLCNHKENSNRKRKLEDKEIKKNTSMMKSCDPHSGHESIEPSSSAKSALPSFCNERSLELNEDDRTKLKNKKTKISSKGKTKLKEPRKKKRKKVKHGSPVIEGERIKGLDHASVFNPGQEDEEQSSKQDDFILQRLFKKSGVHSALQHDTIMNSSDPDSVLVESEASKVAKSAARALKASRRHCLQMGAGRGHPTWTGQHGMAGAPVPPPPRFGTGIDFKSKMSSASQQQHFSGSSDNHSHGSINTSSSVLLAKMRFRNTLTISNGEEQGMGGAYDIHGDVHSQLLKEIRDFIATQGRVNGQATTTEILDRFAKKLPCSDAAVFRSLLHEICDFSRHRGDGLWSLKPEFR